MSAPPASEPQRRARIGVVGAGYWATTFYLPFLRDHPHAECVGVADVDDARLAALRDGFGLEVATRDVGRLLAAGCDGVVVASPNHLHRAHAEAALQAGAHVLVEKPMALTRADARAIADAARAAGRVVSLAHGWNYSPIGTWAADALARGELGPLRSIEGHMASPLAELLAGRAGYGVVDVGGVAIEASAETWARRETGGGYLYGQMSHELGLALLLLDSAPREVFARMDVLASGVDVDAVVSVAFESGAIGSFSGSGRLPSGARGVLVLRLAGERGTMTLDFERDRADAFLQRPGDPSPPAARAPDLDLRPAPGAGVYDCEGPARFLVDLCRGLAPRDRAPALVGVRAVAVMEAAWRSAEERRPIEIPEEM